MILVIGTHTTLIPGGYVGVDIFFVLSGYLITTILLREREQGRWSLKRFYLRRARRLYPALVLMLVLGIPFAATLDYSLPHYLGGAALAGTYLSDFVNGFSEQFLGGLSHTWSLAVEEQFYLLWPLVLLALLRFNRRLTWAGLAIATAGMLVSLTVIPWRALYLPLPRGGVLLLGCMLALGLKGRTVPRPTLVSGVSAVALAAVVIRAPFPALPGAGLATALTGIAATGLIAGIVHGGLVARALSFKPLVWVGRRSYGIYLFHFPVLYLLEAHPGYVPNPVGLFAEGFLITLVLAAFSYRLVELPFLRRNRTSAAAVPTASAVPAPMIAGSQP